MPGNADSDPAHGPTSGEDVYAWLVREDPEEPRRVFCRECVSTYVGSGDPNPLAKEDVGDTLVCQSCGADLSNDDKRMSKEEYEERWGDE